MKKDSFAKEKCPVCLNKSFEKFIDFGQVPQSGVFLPSLEQKPKMISLSFEYCTNCAFVRQTSPKALHDYVKDSKNTGHTTPPYSVEIADYLHEAGISNSELIVEIGSNEGSFLDVLSNSGFTNLLGVEPSLFCSETSRKKGYKTERAYFNIEESSRIKKKYGYAGAVVCRHIIEHIPDISGFVISARNLLRPGGTIFIETPDSRDLIYKLRIDELWDQHLSYFTPSNLERLVVNAGLRVDKILVKPYIGERAILLFGSNNHKEGQEYKTPRDEVKACKEFSRNIKVLRRKIAKKIEGSRKPVFCLGASHPQTNFLVFSGIGKYISQIIDDDPVKSGSYVCIPNPVPILTTERFLKSSPAGTIIHAAFGYDSWLERIKKHLKENVEVIKPYDID